ncbi:HipA N-terminal domain-containing protein [Williamwhitmania taraxaci]|uniref:Serine/threonine-protein kinase HipA n=1 Tax=Williamwhitmania taraxaci TaxID=1640674 RepID=A0A1G6MSH7_9BACT|nr:HipA N-terminal domain-containing protein [Williamwhitmania taraxaci]SDC58499.1 serine/threonine-protein kinase HipA [Williamwhitmania taraxaci]
MRKANLFVNGKEAGTLTELELGKKYRIEYAEGYSGAPISLTLPLVQKTYAFDSFPPFFDGLLPEGYQLEGLLKIGKVDRNDLFSQLIAVGDDLVGNVTVKEVLA